MTSKPSHPFPGVYFRTPAGSVGRPIATRTEEAKAVAAARGVRVVYRIAWLLLIGGEVREIRGSHLWTWEELVADVPRSRWTATRPRKVPGP